MIYHGIDIVEVARVRDAARRWGARFLERVFTARELDDCAALGPAPRYESLAARWAAKEAAAKALGVGLSGLGAGASAGDSPLHLHEIEVARVAGGPPELRLHGGAAAAATARGIGRLSLSLSHTAEYAVASVVGLSERG